MMNDYHHLALLAMLHQQHRGTHVGQAVDHAEATLLEVFKRGLEHSKHPKSKSQETVEICFYCKCDVFSSMIESQEENG